DFLEACRARSPDCAPLDLQLEAEHGATVNVVLVLERDPSVAEPSPQYPLDGWTIEKCAVILADVERSPGSAPLAWFTEVEGERVNQELLHFGRAHCEGLWLHGKQLAVSIDEFEEDLVAQIAGWVEHVRLWRRTSRSVPRDPEARARWIGKRLGLVDARLARLLAREMDGTRPAVEVAELLWQGVPPWPGESGIPATTQPDPAAGGPRRETRPRVPPVPRTPPAPR
ncbi:MAG: hypothetical protein AAF211_33970, partial [Myxococcota bacterium]